MSESLPTLDPQERRILGVMVEKAKTTPDVYPMSINSITTGCNQKSNRDPIMNMSDENVEDALVRCQQKGLTIKITGGRVIRWRHNLYESLQVDKVELAILAELLLRGAQTEGELRGRAARMEPIDDVDALRPVLKKMSERKLVVYLTEEGRRGTMVTHGLYMPSELERLRRETREAPVDRPIERSAQAPVPMPRQDDGQVQQLREELQSLRDKVATLEAALQAVTEQVRVIKEGLGV